MKRPNPRNRPKRDFQTAEPINAESGRILLHPAFDVPRESRRVAFFAGQAISQPKREKMLMTIEFPNDFFVAGFRRIEFVKLFPVLERQVFARQRLEMPVNRRPEIEIQIT